MPTNSLRLKKGVRKLSSTGLTKKDRTMGRSRFKIKETYYPYFITTSVVDGISLFADIEISTILLEALIFLQRETDVILYGYVIMHNHIHIIVEGEELAGKIRTFKSFTAREIINTLKARNRSLILKKLAMNKHGYHKDSEYQVLQEGYHPKQISSHKAMSQKLEYIHYNPVKAGFVDKAEYWRCSSARNYLGIDGMIPLTLFDG